MTNGEIQTPIQNSIQYTMFTNQTGNYGMGCHHGMRIPDGKNKKNKKNKHKTKKQKNKNKIKK